MSAVKVSEFLYGRLQSPDLDQAETFLSEFGMVRVARTRTALYMRGSDPVPHIHITELGEPRFLGLGFAVSNSDDLKRLAKLPGASGIESIDEPGGGKRVRLTDPDGHGVEIVHGVEAAAALKVPRQAVNSAANRPRNGEFMRPPHGPSHVKRLGHGVVMTTDLRRKVAWYRDTLGVLASDDVYAGSPDNLIGSFNRLDRGETYVDHHVLFCIQGKKTGLNHLAYEVQDVDDVMIGHDHLKTRGYAHVWGVGRHRLGSHIYDYWQDPWGRVHEHWTDTDTLQCARAARSARDRCSQRPMGGADPAILRTPRLGLTLSLLMLVLWLIQIVHVAIGSSCPDLFRASREASQRRVEKRSAFRHPARA